MTMDELIEVLQEVPPEIITEATINRIFQHLNAEYGFAILSASRDGNTPAENNRLSDMLAEDIRSMGYGFLKAWGSWEETRPDGTKIEVREASFIVPKMTAKDALTLGHKYNQEAVLWGNNKGVYQIWVDTNEWEKIGSSPKLVDYSKIFTQYKGRKFVFEYAPQGMMSALGFAKQVLEILERHEDINT